MKLCKGIKLVPESEGISHALVPLTHAANSSGLLHNFRLLFRSDFVGYGLASCSGVYVVCVLDHGHVNSRVRDPEFTTKGLWPLRHLGFSTCAAARQRSAEPFLRSALGLHIGTLAEAPCGVLTT